MNNMTYLSLPAAEAVAGMLAEIYAADTTVTAVLSHWSTGTIDAPASTYTVATNALSDGGLVGAYIGAVALPYTKRDLNTLLPYPFVFPWVYPTNLATLASYFAETFNIVLEDAEFAVTGNSVTGALSGSDRIDATPDPITGYVTFVAQASSGRFVEGSTINLRCTAPGAGIPMATLLALTTALDLDTLTDH